jgi:hypothetical protein
LDYCELRLNITLKIQLVSWWADWIHSHGNEEVVMGRKSRETGLICRMWEALGKSKGVGKAK